MIFIDLTTWIGRLFEEPNLLAMGHNQRGEDLNLGLGWLYYGLGRVLRPRTAVVIGSYRGFVPLVLGRALQDNSEGGTVEFIDPSFVDGFWTDREAVARHFARVGIDNVHHHLMTTQDFVESAEYGSLSDVGLLFVDGYHSKEQAGFDLRAFEPKLTPRAMVLFHDSMGERESTIYGEENAYEVTVSKLVDEFKADPSLQVLDILFGTGLTLVRRLTPEADKPFLDGTPGRRV